MSLSHPGVLKEEQCVSCEDHSRLGDVYHLDIQCGHPAYFDVSVRSTTQSSYISSASRVAATAQRHQDAVEETGCDFIPLVVETFGVWSPFALRMLQTIDDRTTARSGASNQAGQITLFMTAICIFVDQPRDQQCLHDLAIAQDIGPCRVKTMTFLPLLYY